MLDFDLQVYGYDSKIGVPGSAISNMWHTYPSAEINKTQTRLISQMTFKLSENASLSTLFSNAENELQSIQNGGNDNVYNEKLKNFESVHASR